MKGDGSTVAEILSFFPLFQCTASSIFYLETEEALEAVIVRRVSLASWCTPTLDFLCSCTCTQIFLYFHQPYYYCFDNSVFHANCMVFNWVVCLGHRNDKIYFFLSCVFLLLLSNFYIFPLSLFVFMFYWFCFHVSSLSLFSTLSLFPLFLV